MKTILIILLSILAGFCFYTSDPIILTAPAQIFTLLAVLGIGCLVGNMTKGSGKLKKVRKMNKSLLRANGNLRAKNEWLSKEVDYLKNLSVMSNSTFIRLDKFRTENEDLKKSLLSTQGNLKQVQKKYSDAKEQVTLLLFERNHLKETIAESDNALDELKDSGAITLMDKFDWNEKVWNNNRIWFFSHFCKRKNKTEAKKKALTKLNTKKASSLIGSDYRTYRKLINVNEI